MGSETIPLALPKIDLSGADLHPGSEIWRQVRAQVAQALRSHGCFEAVYTKVPTEHRAAIFGALQDLFALPAETKLSNLCHKPFHGYVGQYTQLPLFESLGIDDATLPVVESFTDLMWPDGNPSFSKTVWSFSDHVCELDRMVRRMVLESLGLDKYIESHLGSTHYLIRMQKYKVPETKEAELGLNSHTDKGTVTVLYQSHGGLEVRTEDGEWIPVSTTSPNSFIVMVGDAFMAWTNGGVRSAHHRVVVTGNEERYSIGVFSRPTSGHMFIKAPEELVDEEHPSVFKPYDYMDFLHFYETQGGQKLDSASESVLKAYCGVSY